MTEHVKVYGVKPRIQYTADGSLTTYEFPFAIFSASDLDVYFGENLQDTATYTVTGVGESDGGSVTFAVAPAADTTITIVRNLSIERTSDFQEGATLRAKVLNDELDYQVACQQQIADNLNRSMVLPPYAAGSDVDLTLPMPSAGKAIVWNADGTNLENSTVSVNAMESTLNGYKTAAESAASTATEKADIAIQKATEATSASNQFNGARTNCLSEIPQDIDLELNSGTLTLKAGSKVYVPNGVGVFDAVTLESDITATRTDNQPCVVYYTNNATLSVFPSVLVYSGSTAPTASQYMLWYDTTNNQVKFTSDTGSTWTGGNSLPIAVVSTDGTQISAIKQVFNGLGYVGATVFALPGVKGLIPNGKNADGTLKSISFTLDSVVISSDLFNNSDDAYATLTDEGLLVRSSFRQTSYDNQNNYIRRADGLYKTSCLMATLRSDSNRIVSFQPKVSFHAIDWCDKDQIVDLCLPDYSAGVDIATAAKSASGYTAPKDGEITFLQCVGSNACTNTINGITILAKPSTGGGYSVAGTFMVSAGDVFKTTADANMVGSIYFFPFKGV